VFGKKWKNYFNFENFRASPKPKPIFLTAAGGPPIWPKQRQPQPPLFWLKKKTKENEDLLSAMAVPHLHRVFSGHGRQPPDLKKEKIENIPTTWRRRKRQTERKQKWNRSKQGLKSTGLCVFLLLQATVVLTAGRKVKRRRSWAGSTRFPGFLALACGEDAPPMFLQSRRCSQQYLEFLGFIL